MKLHFKTFCFFIVVHTVNYFGQFNDSTWRKLDPLDTSGKPIYDVYFVTQDLGFVSGTTLPTQINGFPGVHIIGKTTDGGISWDTTVTFYGGWGNFIDFLNDSVGYSGDPNILRTSDQGENWDLTYRLYGGQIRSIEFTDDKNGWAVSVATPRIFKTNDAGLTWIEKFPDDTLNQGFYMSAIDSNTVYIASDEFLSFTDDGGETWSNIPIPALFDIYRIKEIIFINKNYDMLFSEYCSILVTKDGGQTWFDRSTSACDYPISAADAIGSLSITIATSGGEILRTDDGGIIWTKQLISEPFTRFNRIDMVNKDVSYVVGHLGIMYKTTNGGVTYVNETQSIIPKHYYLSNNYPNPFNPSTTIEYRIPKLSDVRINVFNILGEKVATLVNEHQHPGTYKVEFNAEGLSSGIYYYQLRAGNYSATKKMLLIK